MTANPTAPAAMPSEEDVARVIYHSVPRNKPWDVLTHEFKNQYRKQARAILDLFAPILAEKEQEIAAAIESHDAWAKSWHDKLEAAEAALAAGSRPNVEIRRNDDGLIDEVVAVGVSVHLEQMDDHSWYLGLNAPGQVWQFWLNGKRRTKVTLDHEHSTYTPRAAAIRAQGE